MRRGLTAKHDVCARKTRAGCQPAVVCAGYLYLFLAGELVESHHLYLILVIGVKDTAAKKNYYLQVTKMS